MIQNYFDNVKRILGSLISNARAREGWGKAIYLFPTGGGGGIRTKGFSKAKKSHLLLFRLTKSFVPGPSLCRSLRSLLARASNPT